MLTMNRLKKIVWVSGLLLLPSLVKAQGCSDAGFCTLGNLKESAAPTNSERHALSLTVGMGSGDEKVFVLTPLLQYDFSPNDQLTIQTKVAVNYASGNLGNAGGLGDIYLSGTYTVNPEQNWKWSAMVGVKLPLNPGNLEENGQPLPMQYQSSLGTFDAIIGASVRSNRWQFSAGLQQPLSGENKNEFLPTLWPGNNDAEKYPATSSFSRKADVLLRGAYHFITNNKFQLTAGLLGIYHVSNDTYQDPATSDQPITIDGSDGLTLNLTTSMRWSVGSKFQIGLVAGAPVVTREIRPDGLTRSFVVSPEIRWSF
ncbi:MAG TPA: hypothetical protein VFU05_13670 [Cyclobacteriaceae bacterium]|nr:hypothetical protein [Cyclobacteriaceae bacterium]